MGCVESTHGIYITWYVKYLFICVCCFLKMYICVRSNTNFTKLILHSPTMAEVVTLQQQRPVNLYITIHSVYMGSFFYLKFLKFLFVTTETKIKNSRGKEKKASWHWCYRLSVRADGQQEANWMNPLSRVASVPRCFLQMLYCPFLLSDYYNKGNLLFEFPDWHLRPIGII